MLILGEQQKVLDLSKEVETQKAVVQNMTTGDQHYDKKRKKNKNTIAD